MASPARSVSKARPYGADCAFGIDQNAEDRPDCREHKDGNKKKNYIYLSEAGRTLRAELEPLAVEVNEVASQGVPDDCVNQLRSVLIHMYENLSLDEANAVKRGHSMPSTRELGDPK